MACCHAVTYTRRIVFKCYCPKFFSGPLKSNLFGNLTWIWNMTNSAFLELFSDAFIKSIQIP